MPCWAGCELPCLPRWVGSEWSRTFKHPAGFSGRHRLDLYNGCLFPGKSLGIGALLIAAVLVAAGLGLWLLKAWGRSLTLALVGVWLFVGVIGLWGHTGPFHIVRVIVDAVVVIYLLLPQVKRRFGSAPVLAK